MLRLTFLLRRKADLSRADFQDYWRRQHGPLVAGFQSALGTRKYVQCHTIDDPANDAMAEARGGMETPYDGVAEMWWDNDETLAAANATAAARDAGAALVEDESKFIDLAQSPVWLNHEYPQVNPSPENLVARPRNAVVKLYYPLRPKPDLEASEAQQYWRTTHGPIIRSQAAASLILRYIQVHRFEHPMEAGLRKARGTATEPYMGHAELWFDRRLRGSPPEAADAGQRAIEDEAKFIDFSRSCMFYTKEHVFVDHTQGD